jgi:prephenate dehydrogenase
VVVIGLGLMGGSLARALKELDRAPDVLGIDPDEDARRLATEAGAVDLAASSATGADVREKVRAADVVVYATPLRATLSLLREHGTLLGEETLVTDLVGLKEPVLKAAESAGLGARFVGGHPVCGGESSGFAASRADLFRGATVWLCPGKGAPPERVGRAEAFWGSVGGDVRSIDAGEHDRAMAWVSHLPQLVANALAGALDAQGFRPDQLGPGGRDMTRLAGSNPRLWKDLLEASAPVTGVGLTSIAQALNVVADLLARRDMDRIAEFMERTRTWREGKP